MTEEEAMKWAGYIVDADYPKDTLKRRLATSLMDAVQQVMAGAPREIDGWINVESYFGPVSAIYATKELADRNATSRRIAYLHLKICKADGVAGPVDTSGEDAPQH